MGMPFSLRNKKIWVTGHNGMVGSALVRRLTREGCKILIVPRADLDLRRQQDVENWMEVRKPDAVILTAARVGGIKANNDYPADFLYDNLTIETNVIHAAHKTGVTKLLFLGSSCIYPRDTVQPISEDSLLTAPLEPTNEWYAIAKIAGIKLCQAYRRQHGCDFISAMPCNLYGPGDTYDTMKSHVIPALIMKMHAARESRAPAVELWGTGSPLREFLYVDDCTDALIHLFQVYSDERIINVGSGEEVTIRDLAIMIAETVGYEGRITFNSSFPDGTPRKLMDSGRLRQTGWMPRTALREGLVAAYADFRERVFCNAA